MWRNMHKYIKPTLCALLVCGMPIMHPCCTCFSRTWDYIPVYLPLSSALAYLPVVNHPSPVFLTSPFTPYPPLCLLCFYRRPNCHSRLTRHLGLSCVGVWRARCLDLHASHVLLLSVCIFFVVF